jgi:predicted phosphodiesterase
MRVFTVSDIHIDYAANRKWLHNLSRSEYQNDALILAGDITDVMMLVIEAFETLTRCFAEVFYVPGNHDLWVHRNGGGDSLAHFLLLQQVADDYGIRMAPAHLGDISIVPLFGWYDYSFGRPSQAILKAWVDFAACKWPDDFDESDITRYFISMNEAHLDVSNQTVISFSHFMPRIDLMPDGVPADKRFLYPVLGTTQLEAQVRQLAPDIHIYGHSHINRYLTKEDVLYINNAFGYPHETRTRKKIISVFESE